MRLSHTAQETAARIYSYICMYSFICTHIHIHIHIPAKYDPVTYCAGDSWPDQGMLSNSPSSATPNAINISVRTVRSFLRGGTVARATTPDAPMPIINTAVASMVKPR